MRAAAAAAAACGTLLWASSPSPVPHACFLARGEACSGLGCHACGAAALGGKAKTGTPSACGKVDVGDGRAVVDSGVRYCASKLCLVHDTRPVPRTQEKIVLWQLMPRCVVGPWCLWVMRVRCSFSEFSSAGQGGQKAKYASTG